jgi:hypothetical protein
MKKASYVAFWAASQVQRSDFGTPASASSMCSPQPAQVGLLQFGQVTRRHMGNSSAVDDGARPPRLPAAIGVAVFNRSSAESTPVDLEPVADVEGDDAVVRLVDLRGRARIVSMPAAGVSIQRPTVRRGERKTGRLG